MHNFSENLFKNQIKQIEADIESDYQMLKFGSDDHHAQTRIARSGSTTCKKCVSGDGIKKRIFGSFIEAESSADDFYESSNRELEAYRCPVGSGWHLRKPKYR
ncbi:hypothetical protein [Pseudoalteromonas rhizosphaerae]|uniref:hypothetical protein n=1 Tax=Pseudoalteromonas rhizosphaerae TaxID=2518973 RepID=UPI0012306EA0|nr:hypothetical protein [Pseudoalteromonas rhizosphaerae]